MLVRASCVTELSREQHDAANAADIADVRDAIDEDTEEEVMMMRTQYKRELSRDWGLEADAPVALAALVGREGLQLLKRLQSETT